MKKVTNPALEKAEEKVGKDLDNDNEKGELPAHKAKVLGKNAKLPKPKFGKPNESPKMPVVVAKGITKGKSKSTPLPSKGKKPSKMCPSCLKSSAKSCSHM